MLNSIHENHTYERRLKTLSNHISSLISDGSSILDIGCGDGQISEMIQASVDGSSIEGIDIMGRSVSTVKVSEFDGKNIPFSDDAFDDCVFVDVLHHTEDPLSLLKEASRVAKKSVIIKDHLSESMLDEMTLRFMDYVGNKKHGVVLPYNYFSQGEWQSFFDSLGWTIDTWDTDLSIYPKWCSWAFDRKLHFIARLNV